MLQLVGRQLGEIKHVVHDQLVRFDPQPDGLVRGGVAERMRR
jgi:hypothetical protein